MPKKKRKGLTAGQRGALEPVDKAVGGPADKMKAARVHKDLMIKAATLGSSSPAPFRVWYKETWPKIKGGG